ncbi:D-alanyl-D-alanine carboxypeptidase [Streptomyces solincola]|uniref:D-alanyl-D-alanine carboxypeptidase n=2 Tax=Streptomyces solincola TaxID=2100817 RepID=A0A2S9PW39_9ACTN|nr:D-alanyl-D-alanine carboxypeptidase [Streptomyces solincola]
MNQLHTPNASRNQEARRLSFMGSVSPAVEDGLGRGAIPRMARIGVVVAVTAGVLLSAGPAVAAPGPDAEDKQPKPPAGMSRVGGVKLGRPGIQVNLTPGVPALPKQVTGRSWVVADAESGQILAANNAHWRLAPASTMKMLFADTLLPRFPRTQSYQVKPGALANLGAGSSLVGIKEKQSYTVHDLWLGVFLRSGNDAVHVLSQMNGGIAKTVKEMNARADELQALDTHVVSPDGYDEPGQVSSAYDLTLIARSGLQKADFREYAATPRANFPGEAKKGKKREAFEIQNTNKLLTGDFDMPAYQGIAGVKNGSTTHAGQTFTGVAERNGRVLLVTVMNPLVKESHAVYREAGRLLDWGFTAAGKVKPVGELVAPKSAEPGGGESGGNTVTGGIGEVEGNGGTGQIAGTTGEGERARAAGGSGAGGAGTALAVAGGALALLVGGVLLVNRRWPLPDLVRRRRPPQG